MANSQFEYVKTFEQHQILLPNTFIVVRIDGRAFHHLAAKYEFQKPNDRRALDLMNDAASGVIKEIPDVIMAYGVSDEYSFIFERECRLFDRRESKLLTLVVSTFTSYFVYSWPKHLPDKSLSPPMPSFDGRVVLFPSTRNLRDYLSWRQADCHINNLYNTTFWALVDKGGMTGREAEEHLKGTLAADKNEILFSRFGINYNNEAEIYKKGSVLFREYQKTGLDSSATSSLAQIGSNEKSKTQTEKEKKRRQKASIVLQHVDIIRDDFWNQKEWLLPKILE